MALYDPGQEPKVADFTIADVLAWARTKPADEKYNFYDASNCAVARFGKETGRLYLIGIGELQSEYPSLAYAVNPLEEDWTFGGLVKRLEALV